MPELPEVETIVRDLGKCLIGKKILKILVIDQKVSKLLAKEIENLIGQSIKDVTRRAKMIIFKLEDGNNLIIHLKMTGQLVVKSKRELIAGGHPISHIGRKLPNKFTRVIFDFNNGTKMYFNDVRRFGWVKLISSVGLVELNQDLGIEPLSKDFSLDKFKDILSHKLNTTIKQSLTDQKYLSGLGNIYSDEALFLAGIMPMRRVKDLKQDEVKRLWQVIPKILKYAIKYRGTSFSDYVDAQGEVGNFIKYLKVYGREGEKCKKCNSIVQKIKIGGRSAHWCSSCQR